MVLGDMCIKLYEKWDKFMKKINVSDSAYDDFKKYSIAEIANMLGLGKTKTRELLQSKILPVTKLGRDYFTSPKALQEFMKKNVGNELLFK